MTMRNIPFARPWITDEEKQAVLKVLDGYTLTHGPQCKEFEQRFSEFLGQGANSVTVSSCMAALHLAYLHLDIGKGDDVIVPAQTHTATVHAVEWVGARPVFVDCDLSTGNINVESIEEAITSRTKAISVVHFLGIPCNMPEIMSIADKYNLKVVEDCAIALGARYGGKHVGLFGDVGCFSFYPVKHITTAEGGMFVTKHHDVIDIVSKLREFGVDRIYTERTIPGMYDVVMLGTNYRMSELQAAIGIQQIRKIKDILDRRQKNFNQLKRILLDLDGILIIDSNDANATSSHYCLSIVLQGALQRYRNDIVLELNRAGVGTSVYYPQPVPRMSYYKKKYGYDATRFRNAEQISDCSIALPVGPHISSEDIDYISNVLKNILRKR